MSAAQPIATSSDVACSVVVGIADIEQEKRTPRRLGDRQRLLHRVPLTHAVDEAGVRTGDTMQRSNLKKPERVETADATLASSLSSPEIRSLTTQRTSRSAITSLWIQRGLDVRFLGKWINGAPASSRSSARKSASESATSTI
jgi:hypothetical protein